MLEECGILYNVKYINIGAGDQFKPDFMRINPNNRMPAIIDHEPLGATLRYQFLRAVRFLSISRKRLASSCLRTCPVSTTCSNGCSGK